MISAIFTKGRDGLPLLFLFAGAGFDITFCPGLFSNMYSRDEFILIYSYSEIFFSLNVFCPFPMFVPGIFTVLFPVMLHFSLFISS